MDGMFVKEAHFLARPDFLSLIEMLVWAIRSESGVMICSPLSRR